jgi:hypothetical protein
LLLQKCTITRAINRGKNNDGLSVINCGAMIPPKSGGQKDPEETLQTAVSAPLLISFLCENKKNCADKKIRLRMT